MSVDQQKFICLNTRRNSTNINTSIVIMAIGQMCSLLKVLELKLLPVHDVRESFRFFLDFRQKWEIESEPSGAT